VPATEKKSPTFTTHPAAHIGMLEGLLLIASLCGPGMCRSTLDIFRSLTGRFWLWRQKGLGADS
jgi:hypothetical protein